MIQSSEKTAQAGFCFASPWNESKAKIGARGSKTSLLSRSRLKYLLLLTGWAKLSPPREKSREKQTAGKMCFHKWSQCPAGAEKRDWMRYSSLHGRFLVFNWHLSEEVENWCSLGITTENIIKRYPIHVDKIAEVWGFFFFLLVLSLGAAFQPWPNWSISKEVLFPVEMQIKSCWDPVKRFCWNRSAAHGFESCAYIHHKDFFLNIIAV